MTANDKGTSPLVAVLRHRGDVYGESTARNVMAALGQSRIDHVAWEISEPLPQPLKATAILICTESLSQAAPGTAAALERFVSDGGGIVVLHRGLHDAFCGLFGILHQDRSAAVTPDYGAAGLFFPSRTLPSFEGLRLDEEFLDGHASFDVVPVENARVVATTWTGKPLAWRVAFASGNVLYWNTTIFSYRRTRGLIVESLQCVVPVSVIPIANAGVVQIDDFPAPLAVPSTRLAATSRPEQFFGRIWWPDVHRLATRYGVALSCFAMFDYSKFEGDAHKNPYSMIESEECAAIKWLPPAEIGLHGYNHLPLTTDYWPDRAAMVQSIERAIAEWRQAGLGPLPTSYVPPMNAYDSDGIAALVEVIPGMQTISGALEGSLGSTTPQDFGPEPWNGVVFGLPRATCGYECSQEFLFNYSSEVAAMGVWTHYLHPDDLMDVPRPGQFADPPRNPHARPWRGAGGRAGLYDQLGMIFADAKSRFPWLVYRPTSDAAATVKCFLESEWKIEISADRVVIDCPVGGYFRFRTNGTPPHRILACQGAEILHHDFAEDYRSYVIETHAARVEIDLGQPDPPKSRMKRLVAALRLDRRAPHG